MRMMNHICSRVPKAQISMIKGNHFLDPDLLLLHWKIDSLKVEIHKRSFRILNHKEPNLRIGHIAQNYNSPHGRQVT